MGKRRLSSAKKVPRKRYRRPNRQLLEVTVPNEIIVYSFVLDSCFDDQNLKCLTLISKLTTENLFIAIAEINCSKRWWIFRAGDGECGHPKTLRYDHGPMKSGRALKN